MTSPHSVLLVAHHERSEVASVARRVADWFTVHGYRPWLTPADAAATGLDSLASAEHPSTAGLAVSLGGDGTVLRTVHLLEGAGVPVLGVNLGTLG